MDVLRDVLSSVKRFVADKVLPFFEKSEGAGRRCEDCGNPIQSSDPQMMVCSERCLHNLWISVQESYAKQSGKNICSLPGCDKECYKDDNRVHDYCGRSHSEIHLQQIKASFGYTVTGIKRCSLPDCKKLCYINDFGQIFDYCTKTHADIHRQMTPLRDYTKGKAPIYFYNKYEEFYEFTNFFEFAPCELDGKEWHSTEQYFQAQKFVGTPYEEYMRFHAGSPREAFQLARHPGLLKWQRSDWDSAKLHVMYKALLAKFIQHERLRQLLLSTGDRKLVEHTFNDSFWGDGGTGSGLNHLGKLLERVREFVRKNSSIAYQ